MVTEPFYRELNIGLQMTPSLGVGTMVKHSSAHFRLIVITLQYIAITSIYSNILASNE